MFITVSQVVDNGNIIELTIESSHIVTMEPIMRRYADGAPREDRRSTGAKTRLEFATRRTVEVLETTDQIRNKLAGIEPQSGAVCGQTQLFPPISQAHLSDCTCEKCKALDRDERLYREFEKAN
jgi:hypothetical protein